MAKPINCYLTAVEGTPGVVRFHWTWPLPAYMNWYHDQDYNVAYRYARIMWHYTVADGIWRLGEDVTVGREHVLVKNTDENYYDITIPDNAQVIRAIVWPRFNDNKGDADTGSWLDIDYSDPALGWGWTWSDEVFYYTWLTAPDKPSAPTTTANKIRLITESTFVSRVATHMQFEFQDKDGRSILSDYVPLKNDKASFITDGTHNGRYQARVKAWSLTADRSIKVGSEWSEWSDYIYTTPDVPQKPRVSRVSSTSVRLSWDAIAPNAKYIIEYADRLEKFDSKDYSSSNEVETTNLVLTGLDSGTTYYFRLVTNVYNDKNELIGTSDPSEIVSIGVGKRPNPPTTWSSTTTAIVGDTIRFYWTHNAADNSRETTGQIGLTINGGAEYIRTIQNEYSEDDDPGVYSFEISTDTPDMVNGATISWRVRTKGIDLGDNAYSDWSISREVKLYTRPSVTVSMPSTVASFPFTTTINSSGGNQTPTAYYITIQAKSNYTTVDNAGNLVTVSNGQRLYTRFINSNEKQLTFDINANDVYLASDMEYIMSVTVSMDSGLTATRDYIFSTSFITTLLSPRCELLPNNELKAISIKPFVQNPDGSFPINIELSVYRRAADDSFITIAENVPNSQSYILDPHPQFKGCSYRIVARDTTTGSVGFTDVNNIPTYNKSVVIQWDEKWNDDVVGDPLNVISNGAIKWSGQVLEIPYNIDVSEDNDPDVNLVKYIGRKDPVSYYGTQLNTSSQWSMEIPKSDDETIAKLRKLSSYMGDVYVREPSGLGYWAQIKVSFSQTHRELTVPISFDIVKVEGGM